MLTEIRRQGALSIACHPHHRTTRRIEISTCYLWDHRDELVDLVDVWEAANRDDLFSVTSLKHFPYIANSDFHRPRHLYSWKTLVRARKEWTAIKSALRDNVNIAITLYRGESWTVSRGASRARDAAATDRDADFTAPQPGQHGVFTSAVHTLLQCPARPPRLTPCRAYPDADPHQRLLRGGRVRVDTHVHTSFSGNTTIYPLKYLLRESYNSPEGVYRRAKARGMDLVAITDHDTIAGALTIADRPDVLVGCEVTASFPEDGVRVHLGVLGVTEVHHREMQRLRGNIRELLQYLNREELFVSLNHVASRINGDVTATHIAQIMPWINGIEVRNGSRLPVQNRTALALSEACRKVPVAGSDSHTRRGIGRTFVEAPHATHARGVPDRARRGPRPGPRARGALLHDGVGHHPHRRRVLPGAPRRRRGARR